MDKLEQIAAEARRLKGQELLARRGKIDPKTFSPTPQAPATNLPNGVVEVISPSGGRILKGNIFGTKPGPVTPNVEYGVRPGSTHDVAMDKLANQTAAFDAAHPELKET